MAELEKLQWLSRDELRARQFEKLRAVITCAYENVPFYRERYDEYNFKPSDLKDFDDLRKLPLLTKKDIQESLYRLVSTIHPRDQLLQDSSGGSTGVPTVFYTDKRNRDFRRGAALFTDSWTGWRVGEKSSYLWGADRDTNVLRSFKEKMVHKFIYRTSLLNAFQLDEKRMRNHAEALKKERPSLIVAYTNVAFFFGKFLEEVGISIPPPKGIICSAETLTEEKRKVIESSFGCKALNRYGSREIGLIASECLCQNGLHINTEDVFIEIDMERRTAEQEKFGDIIVTDLNNMAMPFIRYRNGDVGTFSEKICPCGRGLPLMGNVKGRTSDFILHKKGHLIHGESFSHAFYGIREILRFQIHQKNINTLEVKIIPAAGFTQSHKSLIEKKVKEIIGEDVKVTIEEVQNISVPVSGKFKFAISDIVV